MDSTNSAAGVNPVDTMSRVAGSQAGSSAALDEISERVGLLEQRLRTLEDLAAKAATRQTETHEHLESLAVALGENADVFREAMLRMANKSAHEVQTLGKAIEKLGGGQDKAFAGMMKALDTIAVEMIELRRVRSALEDEQRKTLISQRRRLEDIARIHALSADRDALELEIQSAAARHRRALRGAPSKATSSPPAQTTAPTAPVQTGVESPNIAREAADVGASQSRSDASALLAEARKAKSARDWSSARDAYAAYVAVRPHKASAWKQYGHMLKENGELEEAKAAYFRSLALAPADVDTCLHLGHLLKNTGDRDLAAEIFGAALAMDPTFRPAEDGLGDLGFPIPDARPVCPKPGNPGTKVARWFYAKRLRSAQSAFSARKWQVAEGRYRALLQERPHDARLMIQIGHTLKEQDKIDAASGMYRRAADQEPLNSDAYLHLGHAAKLAGDSSGARAYYRQALRYWPQNPDALIELREAT